MGKNMKIKIDKYIHDVKIFMRKKEDTLILVLHGGPRSL